MGWEELTPRERAVAEAASSGASTRVIADQLFVSSRTVETHLGSVYRKLGLEGRAQLVAFMLREGQVPTGPDTGLPAATPTVAGEQSARAGVQGRLPGWPSVLTLADVFVGRAVERRHLVEVLRRDGTATPSTVLIGGEPGIGKSALVAQAALDATVAGFQVFAGRCDRDFRAPFGPVADALRARLAAAGDDLAALVGPVGGSLASIVPELSARLPPRLPTDEPAAAQRLVVDAIVACLSAVTASVPALLILEDLQWSDQATLGVFRHLIASSELPSLVLVGTFRNTELSREHPLPGFLADLWREPSVQRIDLEGLDLVDTAALADDLAVKPIDVSGVDALQSRTGGNPFFLLQLLRYQNDPSAPRDLPRSIREVLLDRAARLGDEVVPVLQGAAVLGSEIELPVLFALLTRRDHPLGPDAVASSIEHACSARLLLERAEPALGYHFVHDLVREAMLSELSAIALARLHQAAGDALLAVQGDAPIGNLVALADHFAAAAPIGEGPRAARYALAAAQQALDRLAPRDAAALAAQGLAHTPAGDDRTRFELLVASADAQATLMDVVAHRRATLAAMDVARRMGDAVAMARAVDRNTVLPVMGELDAELLAAKEEAIAALGPQPSTLRARLLTSVSYQRTIGGHGWEAADQASQAVHEGRQLGDTDTLVAGLYALAAASLGRPELAPQLAVADELVAAGEQRVERSPERDGRRFRGLLRLSGGDRVGFAADLAELAEFGTRCRSVFVQSLVGEWRTIEAMLDGELGRAEELANEVLAKSGNDPNFMLGWFVELAWIRIEQDRAGEILPLAEATTSEHPDLAPLVALTASIHAEVGDLEAAARMAAPLAANDCEAVPRDWLRPATLAYLAAAASRSLDEPARRAVAAQLAPYGGQLLIAGAGALVNGIADHLRALLLAASDKVDHDATLALFAAAHATAQRVGGRVLAAHIQIDWAAAHLRRGDSSDVARAHELLAAAQLEGERFGLARVVRKARDVAALTDSTDRAGTAVTTPRGRSERESARRRAGSDRRSR